jgi:hypothetical protein
MGLSGPMSRVTFVMEGLFRSFSGTCDRFDRGAYFWPQPTSGGTPLALTPGQRRYRRRLARLGQERIREIWRKEKAAQAGKPEAVLDQIAKRGRKLDEAVSKFPIDPTTD